MEYSLIANSGIQLFTFRLKINTQDRFKQWFHEWYDTASGEWKLELVHEVCTDDCTVYYKILVSGKCVYSAILSDFMH